MIKAGRYNARKVAGIICQRMRGIARSWISSSSRRYNSRMAKTLHSVLSIPQYGKEGSSMKGAIMQQWGLLGNDALHVACMEEHAIETIATYDRDFSRVSGIKILKTG